MLSLFVDSAKREIDVEENFIQKSNGKLVLNCHRSNQQLNDKQQ